MPSPRRASSPPEAAVEMGGAGMELMERRLEQIQGDPTLLIRNQYRVDELRQIPGVVGPWQEPRPW
jgi:Ca-activated chloride channel homolog